MCVINKIVTSSSINVDDNKMSSVYLGNVVEIITSNRITDNLQKFRKINNSEYVNISTGEIRKYNKRGSRDLNIQGVQKSLTTLRRIINLNFIGDSSERFLTLTYAQIMTEPSQLYKDFKYFISLLRKYHYVDYVCVAEPQQSGSWHIHALVKSSLNKELNISHELLKNLWHHGYSHIKKLPFNTNFGAYFAMRTTDIYVDNFANSSKISKAITKGDRLHFYPSGFRIYRCSQGIKRPNAIRMTYGEAKELTKNMTLCYACSKQIIATNEDGEEKILNTINYEQYKNNSKARNEL